MKIIGKIFKFFGKVIGIILAAVLAFAAVCCIVTLCWGGVQRAKGTEMDLPEVADDFVPEVRVVLFTDSHNENENIKDCVETAYKLYDNDTTYKGVDAFFHLGDFTSIGGEGDYDNYISAISECVREETPIITLLGNHEMKRTDCKEEFISKFGYDPNGVYEINGFTFIAFSGDRSLTEWTFTPSSLKWAADELEKAEEKAGDKAIFVLQHPHNFGTVYGSTVWCDFQTNPIWAGHSKVVNFSGHSHFPMNDPRSINQTTYTSVGIGATARFELDDNFLVGQHPDGYDTANEMCIVEADSQGRVRIMGYDCNSDTFFCDWFIENVNDESTFAYTYKNMKAHDSAPVFKDNTETTITKNDNGEWVLSFDEATDNFIVHDYHIVIKDSEGNQIFKDTFVNDYYVIDDDDTADLRIAGDVLTQGEVYTVYITAENAYHYYSEEFVAAATAQ